MATERVLQIRESKKHSPRGRRKPIAKGVFPFKGRLGRANRRRKIKRSYILPMREVTPRIFYRKLGDYQPFNCPRCHKQYTWFNWRFGENKCECGSVITIHSCDY